LRVVGDAVAKILGNSKCHLRRNPFFQDGLRFHTWANAVEFPIRLSGVFFPRDQLQGLPRVISDWLPLTASVELIRPLFLGQWPAQDLLHSSVLMVYTVGGFWVELALTRTKP
jgi:ABC-type polysaccharide/polyol phosphate export permease